MPGYYLGHISNLLPLSPTIIWSPEDETFGPSFKVDSSWFCALASFWVTESTYGFAVPSCLAGTCTSKVPTTDPDPTKPVSTAPLLFYGEVVGGSLRSEGHAGGLERRLYEAQPETRW